MANDGVIFSDEPAKNVETPTGRPILRRPEASVTRTIVDGDGWRSDAEDPNDHRGSEVKYLRLTQREVNSMMLMRGGGSRVGRRQTSTTLLHDVVWGRASDAPTAPADGDDACDGATGQTVGLCAVGVLERHSMGNRVHLEQFAMDQQAPRRDQRAMDAGAGG